MTERENAEAKAANADGKQEAELQWQLERLQRQSDELREEREGLLRDIDLLKDASEKTKERGTAPSLKHGNYGGNSLIFFRSVTLRMSTYLHQDHINSREMQELLKLITLFGTPVGLQNHFVPQNIPLVCMHMLRQTSVIERQQPVWRYGGTQRAVLFNVQRCGVYAVYKREDDPVSLVGDRAAGLAGSSGCSKPKGAG